MCLDLIQTSGIVLWCPVIVPLWCLPPFCPPAVPLVILINVCLYLFILCRCFLRFELVCLCVIACAWGAKSREVRYTLSQGQRQNTGNIRRELSGALANAKWNRESRENNGTSSPWGPRNENEQSRYSGQDRIKNVLKRGEGRRKRLRVHKNRNSEILSSYWNPGASPVAYSLTSQTLIN